MRQTIGMLAVIALALSLAARWRNPDLATRGWKTGLHSLRRQLPLLAIAFTLAGYLEAVLPRDFIRSWMGAGAGLSGILLGSVAGGLLPLGPYIVFPMGAALQAGGAGIPTLVAFVTGWMLWGTGKLAFEFATLGPAFTLRRMVVYLVFPPLAGMLAYLITGP
ncbi:MAG TPA: hypothetical protein DCM14_08070 [Clostridiales bacterium UBA8153]|nr:hypothetical protein [Clostridiales bacterium UBA8153]